MEALLDSRFAAVWCVWHCCLCFRQWRQVMSERLIPQCPTKSSPPLTSGRNKSWRWRRRRVSSCINDWNAHLDECAQRERECSVPLSPRLLQEFCSHKAAKSRELDDVDLNWWHKLRLQYGLWKQMWQQTIVGALCTSTCLFCFLPHVLFLSLSPSPHLPLSSVPLPVHATCSGQRSVCLCVLHKPLCLFLSGNALFPLMCCSLCPGQSLHTSASGSPHPVKKVQKNFKNNYASVECGAKILSANTEAKVKHTSPLYPVICTQAHALTPQGMQITCSHVVSANTWNPLHNLFYMEAEHLIYLPVLYKKVNKVWWWLWVLIHTLSLLISYLEHFSYSHGKHGPLHA